MRVLNQLQEVVNSLIQNRVRGFEYERDRRILLKAMVNSAKAGGTISKSEQNRILNFMGKMKQKERTYVYNEMQKPLDIKAFIKEIPKGMEQRVYYMSLFSIDLYNESEIRYIDRLAKELKLDFDVVSSIHASLGVARMAS